MSSVNRETRLPRGPGIFESLAWTASYLIAQLLAIAVFMTLFVFIVFGRWPADFAAIVDLCLAIELDRSFVPLGVTNLLCLFLLVPLVRWRLGRGAREYLKVNVPRFDQLVLVTGSILPLAIVSEQLYRWSLDLWAMLAGRFPSLAPFANGNAVEMMVQFTRGESFPVLVVAIALGPAIGEELIFRGLIGNGLCSRWGRTIGMGVTTLLFAAAHGFPPHALATIPIGLYLHHVYLTTRSYWMAVIVHFLNNLLVITLARYGVATSLPCSPALLFCSTGYVLMTAALLSGEQSVIALRQPIEPAPPRSRGVLNAISWTVSSGFDSETMALAGHTRLLAAAIVLTFTSAFVWAAVAGP